MTMRSPWSRTPTLCASAHASNGPSEHGRPGWQAGLNRRPRRMAWPTTSFGPGRLGVAGAAGLSPSAKASRGAQVLRVQVVHGIALAGGVVVEHVPAGGCSPTRNELVLDQARSPRAGAQARGVAATAARGPRPVRTAPSLNGQKDSISGTLLCEVLDLGCSPACPDGVQPGSRGRSGRPDPVGGQQARSHPADGCCGDGGLGDRRAGHEGLQPGRSERPHHTACASCSEPGRGRAGGGLLPPRSSNDRAMAVHRNRLGARRAYVESDCSCAHPRAPNP